MEKRIDVTGIDNFDSLSADELREFIKGYTYDDLSEEVQRYKDSNSKANSQIAEMKKTAREKLSEDERKRADEEEKYNAMQEELALLKKDKQIADYTTEYISMGYSAELARSSAEAFFNGDRKSLIENEKKFLSETSQKAKDELLNKQPRPEGGATVPTVMTKEAFISLSTEKQIEYIKNNPNWKTDLK